MNIRLAPQLKCQSPRAVIWAAVSWTFLLLPMMGRAQPASSQPGYDDHQNMMDQLGIKAIRRGPDPNNQSTFDEATANPYKESMPDVLRMKDGKKVARAGQWQKRRAEILEDFEREVYGRIPKNVPRVTWEVTSTKPGDAGGIATVTKTLVGHVDNSAYPQISVNIQANFTVPASVKKPVPPMIEFGFGFNQDRGKAVILRLQTNRGSSEHVAGRRLIGLQKADEQVFILFAQAVNDRIV